MYCIFPYKHIVFPNVILPKFTLYDKDCTTKKRTFVTDVNHSGVKLLKIRYVQHYTWMKQMDKITLFMMVKCYNGRADFYIFDSNQKIEVSLVELLFYDQRTMTTPDFLSNNV